MIKAKCSYCRGKGGGKKCPVCETLTFCPEHDECALCGPAPRVDAFHKPRPVSTHPTGDPAVRDVTVDGKLRGQVKRIPHGRGARWTSRVFPDLEFMDSAFDR